MKMLVTGGAGFMGSHFVRHLVNKYPEYKIINFDKLTYAGNLERIKDIENKPNYEFIKGDVCDFNFLVYLFKDVDYVFHFAAESHVDNSIGDSLRFTESNTVGTHVLLEAARINKVKRVFHISTDEVYGDIISGSFSEEDKILPTNPYSSSKAAAEMIIKGYLRTYKVPITIIRSNNVYGPYQYVEKIIPRFVTNLIQGKKVPLHGNGANIRTYIYVEDFCNALDLIFRHSKEGEIFNIGTSDEISNLELTRKILSYLGKTEEFIEFVNDRPFNDQRYSVNISKIKKIGWVQKVPFSEGLISTIEWYKNNDNWWKSLSGHPSQGS